MSRGNSGSESLGGFSNPDTRGRVLESGVDRESRVHWPAIIAGLFAVLSLLTVLIVLGSAIGLSAMSEGDALRNYAMGAGWWAAISGLIAFAFGGWVAARNSPSHHGSGGWINGAMVWAVAVPMTLLFAGGIGTIAGGAAAVQKNPAGQYSSAAQDQNNGGADQARPAGAQMSDQVVTPSMANASSVGAKTVWATLVSLVLGFAAAAAGGYLGTREDEWDTGRKATNPISGHPAI